MSESAAQKVEPSVFEKAIKDADAKGLKDHLSDSEKLKLYANYKIATNDPAKPASSMFDFQQKAKYNEYQKLVKEGVTAEQAKEEYVKLVGEFLKKYKLAD